GGLTRLGSARVVGSSPRQRPLVVVMGALPPEGVLRAKPQHPLRPSGGASCPACADAPAAARWPAAAPPGGRGGGAAPPAPPPPAPRRPSPPRAVRVPPPRGGGPRRGGPGGNGAAALPASGLVAARARLGRPGAGPGGTRARRGAPSCCARACRSPAERRC